MPFHFLDSLDPEILNTISTNIWLNLAFFAIFVFFAFSFFGYYEITLPASWSNKMDNASNVGGIIGIFFMALTLAIVSFSCTGPILGSLLAGSLTAEGGAWQLTAGMAGFGTSLALPFAVFALLAGVVVSANDPEILKKLAFYTGIVLIGLSLMIVFYMVVAYIYTKKTPSQFFKAISPAQLLAFSTSSSAATLPVTMERVNEHLGVDEEVSSFVLPVGATINMDGTSLYQAVAAVFIAQAMSFPLDFTAQLTIVFTALLASIGSAAVPGAGMVMLVIVLESIGFPADKLAVGLALIFAVDRPLDMCRTVVNVTGDAFVSLCVGKSLDKLHEPHERKWDENHKLKIKK